MFYAILGTSSLLRSGYQRNDIRRYLDIQRNFVRNVSKQSRVRKPHPFKTYTLSHTHFSLAGFLRFSFAQLL